MADKQTNTSEKPQEPSEELAWDFNNELNYTLLELSALKRAKEKIQKDTAAFEQRLGSLNAIQNFINRKK